MVIVRHWFRVINPLSYQILNITSYYNFYRYNDRRCIHCYSYYIITVTMRCNNCPLQDLISTLSTLLPMIVCAYEKKSTIRIYTVLRSRVLDSDIFSRLWIIGSHRRDKCPLTKDRQCYPGLGCLSSEKSGRERKPEYDEDNANSKISTDRHFLVFSMLQGSCRRKMAMLH